MHSYNVYWGAAFYPVEELKKRKEELAFDHAKLLDDLLRFVEEKKV